MASTSGGAAVAGDDEKRKIELFTLGLRTDGTHTRMSADATGDKLSVYPFGWCLYSSYLAVFEELTDMMRTADSPAPPAPAWTDGKRKAYHHTFSQQFARFLATEIRKDAYLRAHVIRAILLDSEEVIQVSNPDGTLTAPAQFGYRIAVSPAAGAPYITGHRETDDKYQFIDLGSFDAEAKRNTLYSSEYVQDNSLTPDNAETFLDFIGAGEIQLDKFLRELWQRKPTADFAYEPTIYADYRWFAPVVRHLFPWIKFSARKDNGISINADERMTVEGQHLHLIQTEAHYDPIIFEYVPPEITLRFDTGVAEQAAALLLAGKIDDVRAMEDKWRTEWDQAGGGAAAAAGAAGPPQEPVANIPAIAPQEPVSNVPAVPATAADPTLAEAAAAVADMLDAVATAGKGLLGKGGNQPPSGRDVASQPVVLPIVSETVQAAPPPPQAGSLTKEELDEALRLFFEANPSVDIFNIDGGNVDEDDGDVAESNTKEKPVAPIDLTSNKLPALPAVPTGPIEIGPLTVKTFEELFSSMPQPIGEIGKVMAFDNLVAQITALLAFGLDDKDQPTLLKYRNLVNSYLITLTVFQMKPDDLKEEQVSQIDGLRKALNKFNNGITVRLQTVGRVNPVVVRDVIPPSYGAPSGGNSGLPDSDKDEILKRLNILEANLDKIPKTADIEKKEGGIRKLIDALQSQLITQQQSIAGLRGQLDAIQTEGVALSPEQTASFDALKARVDAGVDLTGVGAQIRALQDAIQLRATREELADLVKPTAAGGTIPPGDTDTQIRTLIERLEALEKGLGAHVAAGASSSSPAVPRAEIQQIRAELAKLTESVASGKADIDKRITDAIAAADERLGKIEGNPPAVAAPALNLTAITSQLDTLTTKLTELTTAAAASAAKDKATQDALAGIQQQLDALRAVRTDVVKQQAVAAALIKMPPPLPTGDAGRPSWFNPAAGQYSARIAEDLAGFQAIIDGEWLDNRTRNAQQAKYRDAMGEIQAIKDNKKPLSSNGSGDESFAKELKKKQAVVAAAFPDRTVFIDGKGYTVRNPYATLQQRMDVSDQGFFMNPVPEEGNPLRLNVQVLQAFAPPAPFGEFLADNKRAIAILESLWHCGNQQGADLDPKCFPARVIEELREYNALQEASGASKSLRDAILKGTGMPTVIGYLRRLLELAKPAPLPAADAKPLPAPAPAEPAPAPAPPNGGGGGGSGPTAHPAPKRKPLPILTPGLGSGGAGVSAGGRRLPFIPPPKPGLGFVPVIPAAAEASN